MNLLKSKIKKYMNFGNIQKLLNIIELIKNKVLIK